MSDRVRRPSPSRHLQRMPASYAIARAQKQRAELEKRGVRVVDLSIGEPDLPPPAPVLDALGEVSHAGGYTRYPPFAGTRDFREAVCRFYQRRYGVALDPDRQVLPLVGSKEGLVHLALAFCDEARPVYARSVDYPVYRTAALLAEAPLRVMGGGWDDGYTPTLPDDGAEGGVVFVGSPGNPTGAVVRKPALEALMRDCERRGAVLAFDAAYLELPGSGERPAHPLAIDPAHSHCLEFHTFSKSLRVPGWRVGFAVGSAELLASLGRMKSFIDAGVPLPQQHALTRALDGCDAFIDEGAAVYRKRQAQFRAMLEGLPLEVFSDDATLFCWCRVKSGDGEALADAAVQEGLLLMAGSAFGPGGKECVRMAVNVGEADLPEVRARLERAFARLT